MKTRKRLAVTVIASGLLAFSLARYRRMKVEGLAWRKQLRPALDVLACPKCLGLLTNVKEQGYFCQVCQREYPTVDGITHFLQPEEMTGWNKRFSGLYDWFSWVYRAFSFVAFALIGIPEEQARRAVTDRLQPMGGRVLEVSIGPGVNLPYLIDRYDVGEIFGLDISLGQLNRCKEYVAHQGWNVQLQLGNAEQLPYLDNTFDGVFHIGGINFFNDKQKAIEEMIRVAKPGTRILIADESEKGAQVYERTLPKFKQSFGDQRPEVVPPIDLVPSEMEEVSIFDIWKGWMYCIEFRKPLSGM